MATIFTGQEIIGQDGHDHRGLYDVVLCAVCDRPVSLRVAYIDKYLPIGKEQYVHYACLSPERKREIE